MGGGKKKEKHLAGSQKGEKTGALAFQSRADRGTLTNRKNVGKEKAC